MDMDIDDMESQNQSNVVDDNADYKRYTELKANSTLVSSTECMAYEDMPEHDRLIKESEETGGKYTQILDLGDCFVSENTTHYIIADCGIIDLRKKK